jgi:UDP-N-acetylglucosamine 1-carboxyvinyltransferase
MGAVIHTASEGLYVQAPERLRPVNMLWTGEYPEFPTDLQSVILVSLLQADGCSEIIETVFENRFHIVEPLKKMGANLEVLDTNRVRIYGSSKLIGNVVEAKELRGGAAMVIAGLMAEGVTLVRGSRYIARGYENICKDLRELGARITSV